MHYSYKPIGSMDFVSLNSYFEFISVYPVAIMSYINTALILSIITITFAHKKASCDAQITGKTA